MRVFLCSCAAVMLLAAGAAHALTAQEVLLLKQNGVSEETIQLMIRCDMEKGDRDASSISITREKESTTYATGPPAATPLTREEKRNVEQAWEMLKSFHLELED